MNEMYPKHICWWCKCKFEEYNGIHKYKSGWLCDQCKAYLETQSGEKEQLVED